jgi:hypothetical protein
VTAVAENVWAGSAKIYQFPVRGRAPIGGDRQDVVKASADVASLRLPKTVAGSGWYHEAAIQEAQRAVKR